MKDQIIKSVKHTTKYWWISLLIGILAIGLGILFIAKPVNAMVTLAWLFALGFIASGILEIAFSISNRKAISGWGWTLVSGIIDLMLGIILFGTPGMTIIIMSYFIGFWIMFRSIWAIGSSCEMQQANIGGWGWMLALAIMGVLCSFVFIISPAFGGGFIVALASISFIIYGLARIYLSIKYKSIKNEIDKIDVQE